MEHQNRQLAAILFTDIVGSTSMMQKDEQAALSVNKRYVAVLKQSVLSHNGEVLNDFGDGSLCCFSSATQAVRCAIEMQQQFQTEPKVPLRIGLHVGEIFFEDGKVFGDGVNIASRIQSLGIANSILFSSEINSKIKNQQEFKCVSVGRFHFKNVDEPMEVFALSNEGLAVPRKEELTGKLKEIEKKSLRKKLTIASAGLIILAAGFFIYQNFFRTANLSAVEKSIAVLPFENVAVSDSEEYISDGITQGIINNLSKISSLQKVIGWFSVKGFKKTNKSVKQIAEELGVTVILTGTMQRNADKIRIIAELIDVNTNKRLWGNDYNYDWGNVLLIQSEVAQQIVTALRANLSPEEKKGLSKHYTENVEAYKFYRKGRWFSDKRTIESYDSAEANYQRAIQLDPDYALAYSGIADCYSLPPFKGLPELEAIPFAKTYAMKALSIDSTLSEALTTIGFIQSAFDYDWAISKRTLEKAIELNPNYPMAHVFYGNLLQYTGENTEEGINEIRKALNLDPLSASLNWILGRNYYYAHKYDSAYEQLKKTLTLFPDYWYTIETFVYVLLQRKNYSEAIEWCKKVPANDYMGLILSYAYAVSGDTIKAKKQLEKTLKEFPHPELPMLARVYVSLKEYDQALTLLDKAYALRQIDMYLINADPAFDPIRSDSRFKALMRKMNLE